MEPTNCFFQKENQFPDPIKLGIHGRSHKIRIPYEIQPKIANPSWRKVDCQSSPRRRLVQCTGLFGRKIRLRCGIATKREERSLECGTGGGGAEVWVGKCSENDG